MNEVSSNKCLSEYRYGVCNGASGIYYNCQLWTFYPSRSKIIRYRQFPHKKMGKDGTYTWEYKWGKDKTIRGLKTKHSVSPVIFKDKLFVFWVGMNGKLYYTIYGEDEQGNAKWKSAKSLSVRPHSEVAPVYNPQTKILEIYYQAKNNNIKYICYDGSRWFSGYVNKDLKTGSAPSAEVVETGKGEYRVMLAHRSFKKDSRGNDQIRIDFLKNQYQGNNKWERGYFLSDTTVNSPHLVNLGNGSIALLYKGCNNGVYASFYHESEDDPKWYLTKRYNKKEETIYHVRGAAYYIPLVEDNREKEDLKGYLTIFWSKTDRKWQDPHLLSHQAEYLGKWEKGDTRECDWSGIDNEINEIDEESKYSLYPVLGIIDAPPCVLNGKTIKDNNTTVAFEHTEKETEVKNWKLEAGMYAETGVQSPITCEVHAGLTKGESISSEVTAFVNYTIGMTSFYNSNGIQKKVTVLYLAPVTKVTPYKLVEVKKPFLVEKERKLAVVEITDASILSRSCDIAKFKYLDKRTAGNLDSFEKRGFKEYECNSKSVSWNKGGKSEVGFSKKQLRTVESGGYFELKLGVDIAEFIGAGFEGKFSYNFERTEESTDSFVVTLINPDCEETKEGDICFFDTTAYLLRMKPEQRNGYWIPNDRQQTVERPWFITFSVNDYSKIIDSKKISFPQKKDYKKEE